MDKLSPSWTSMIQIKRPIFHSFKVKLHEILKCAARSHDLHDQHFAVSKIRLHTIAALSVSACHTPTTLFLRSQS
jgi:hypothetical protein